MKMLSQGLRISFGCQARTGKTTAVNYLIEKNGGVEKSFAGELYNIMYYTQKVCGFEKKKNREFLQLVGTWARNQDPDVWIKTQFRDYEYNPCQNVFFSDVRFPNEFKALRENCFVMVRIIRDIPQDFGGGNILHESEVSLLSKPLEEWDYVIENNGSLEEFYEKIDEMVKDIEKKLPSEYQCVS